MPRWRRRLSANFDCWMGGWHRARAPLFELFEPRGGAYGAVRPLKKTAAKPQLESDAGRKARAFVLLFSFAIVTTTLLVTIKFGLGKQPGAIAKNSTNVSAHVAGKSTNA